MTATIIENESETFNLDSFDFAPRCDGDVGGVECLNEAKFKAHLRCCGRFVLLCEDCLFAWKEYVSESPLNKFYCVTCNHHFPAGIDPIIIDGRI